MEYELVHEIQNLCPNNQMRDIFFEEIECDSPENWLRSRYRDKEIHMTVEPGAGGAVTIYAQINGMTEKFVFTPI